MLRFNLAGIPVSVHVSFLIIALIARTNRIDLIVVWVVVAFLAVLAHEAGHAFTARGLGAEPVSITLFALGGVTTFSADKSLSPHRRLVISAAGSLVGIVLGGSVWLLRNAGMFDRANDVLWFAASGFIWASLGWGLLNWIPIRPLDGGAILTSFLEIVIPKRAFVVAKVVSTIAGAVAAFALWRMGSTFGAVFVVLITLTGLRADAAEQSRSAPRPAPAPADPGAADDVPATRPVEPGDDTPAPRFPI